MPQTAARSPASGMGGSRAKRPAASAANAEAQLAADGRYIIHGLPGRVGFHDPIHQGRAYHHVIGQTGNGGSLVRGADADADAQRQIESSGLVISSTLGSRPAFVGASLLAIRDGKGPADCQQAGSYKGGWLAADTKKPLPWSRGSGFRFRYCEVAQPRAPRTPSLSSRHKPSTPWTASSEVLALAI